MGKHFLTTVLCSRCFLARGNFSGIKQLQRNYTSFMAYCKRQCVLKTRVMTTYFIMTVHRQLKLYISSNPDRVLTISAAFISYVSRSVVTPFKNIMNVTLDYTTQLHLFSLVFQILHSLYFTAGTHNQDADYCSMINVTDEEMVQCQCHYHSSGTSP